MRKTNRTAIEKKDNSTRRENRGKTARDTSKKGGGGQGLRGKAVMLGGAEYMVERRLDVMSAEADLYLIKSGSGERFVLKYYRPRIEPKPEVVELLRSFSGRGAVRIVDSGRESGRFYEIQEFAEHGTLADIMKADRTPPREFLVEFIRKADECLCELHSKDLIHRDIKPTNILIRKREPLDIALTDFGISSISKLSLHQTNMNRTILYSSPESMSGIIAKGSDYWSLGMILLELVTGRNPFDGVTDKVAMFTLATKAVPGVMELKSEFTPVIKGLLTRNPKKRWGHKELEAWLGGDRSVPVFFGELSDDEIMRSKAMRPFRFEGRDYYSLRDLAGPLARNWHEGSKEFESGAIRDWIARELGASDLLSTTEDILKDRKISADERLFEFLCRTGRDLPIIFRGYTVTRESLADLAAKVIRNTATPYELGLLRDLFRQGIIEKYCNLTGDENARAEFGPVVETCEGPGDARDQAAAVLAHFIDEYARSLAEKTADIFNNYYILDEPSDQAFRTAKEKAAAVAAGEKYSVADLIAASKLRRFDAVKKSEFDAAVETLRKKYLALEEEGGIDEYKDLLSDADWKILMGVARDGRIELTRKFLNRVAVITKLLSGEAPNPETLINTVFYRDNYVDVSGLPDEGTSAGATHARVAAEETDAPKRGPRIFEEDATPGSRLLGVTLDIGMMMLTFLFSITITIATANGPVPLATLEWFHNRFFFVFFLLYIPLIEYFYSSTPGKMIAGVAVTGPDGERMTFFRAFGRTLARFAVYYIYGAATISVYKYFINPAFPASYLDPGSILFFFAFYAGGIFDYIYMRYGPAGKATHDRIAKCAVVARGYAIRWLPTIAMSSAYLIFMAVVWAYLLTPHFDFKNVALDDYAFYYFVDPAPGGGVKYDAGKHEIILAADKGEHDLVRLLLYKYPDSVNIRDENGFTPLFFAAQKGHYIISKLLLERRAEPNAIGKPQETPLTAACAAGNARIVKMLRERGADVNFQNAAGQTPLIIGTMSKNFEIVKTLVEAGAHLELRDEAGFTALLMASFVSDQKIFEYLLSKGADINASDTLGHTPLIVAAYRNNYEIAKELLNRGCDINARGGEKKDTALIVAILNGNSKIAEMLISKSNDLNVSDSNGNSPLMIAVAKGDLWAVSTLIRHGADANHQNNDGNTALMVAASATNERLLKILIKAGAKPGLKNREGYTALQMYNHTIEMRRVTEAATTTTTTTATTEKTLVSEKTPETTVTTKVVSTPELVNVSRHVVDYTTTTARSQGVVRQDVVESSTYGHAGVPSSWHTYTVKKQIDVMLPGAKAEVTTNTRRTVDERITRHKGPTSVNTYVEKLTGPTETSTERVVINKTEKVVDVDIRSSDSIDTFGSIPADTINGNEAGSK